MIDIKSFSKPKKSGNGSGGSSSSVTYISGIASEADHATRADKAKKAEVAEQANVANRATSAQTANYASKAGEVDIESETLQKFFRKDDPAEGEENVAEEVRRKVDFKKAATFEEAADMLKGFTAHELVAFLKGFTIAGQFGIDEYGDMILNTIKSIDYDNAAEQGFSVEKEKNGKYHAFVTNLTIWGKAIFHELEVRKLSYSGGNIYLSGAGSKLVKVIPVKKSVSDGVTSWVETTADDTECVGWKCYLLADNGTTATMNYWQEDDQVRCQTIGEITAGGTYQDASNKSYWRTIPNGGVSTQNEKIYGTMTETYLDEAGKEQTREVQVELYGGQSFAWIVVGKHSEDLDGYTDEDSAPTETRGIPADGDTIVLDGNRHRNEHGEYDKTDRQNVIILETTGEYAPRIACYANISEYEHTIIKSVNGEDKEVSLSVFETSPKGGTKINSSHFEWISNDGSTINIINYRGDWVKGNTYHKNDQVNHNNAVWVCVANSEESVIAEPSDSSTQWKKVLYGGKGEKGDDAVIYTLEASPSYIRLNSDGSIDYTNGYIDKGDEYESDKYLVVRGYKVVKGVRDNRFSTESSPVTLRLTINDGSAYSEYTPSDGDSVSIDFEPKYEDSYYSMLQEISHSGLNSVRVDLCEGSEYNTNKILATCDIPIIRNGKDGQKGDQGDKGEDGVDGTDGISILIERPLVFDTDDTGKVPTSVLQSKKAVVRVMQGGANVSGLVKNLTIDNAAYCSASASVKADQDSGSYIEVQLNSISDVQTEAGVVSAPCGFVVLLFMLVGNPYRVQVPFTVNVAKYMGSVKATAQSLQTKYTKLIRDLSSPSPSILTQYTSAIQQTAKDIVLSVNKKKVGRRNLLYGTAFTRDGLIDSNPRFQPTMTEGMNGMNAVRFSVTAADSFLYYGLFWRGEYGNIPVKRNTDYTFSCWVKSDNPHAMLYTERHSMADATTSKRGTAIPPSKGDTWWRNDGNWQLVTNTFNSGNTDFVEINIFLFNTDENSKPTLNAQAWFCMPMLEEGTEYTGWTLSERDSDYVGGNMLDDTRTFVASSQQSNLLIAQDVTADAYEGAYAVVHGKADESNNNVCDFLRFNGEGGRNLDLGQGKNYVFSFLAKGNGTLFAYMYKDSIHASIYSENSQGYVVQSITNGASNFTLTSQWKRYWVHWRIDPYTGDGDTVLPQSVLLRAVAGCEAWVTKPKLEEGAQMTEYTEKKTDLIDKSTAKAAGLEITADGVELYGDKVMVKNNGKTAALFIGGKINASLIDADQIEVKHLWAKSNDGANKVGYFGNTEEDACKIGDNTLAPLFVGGATAKESPFYVTSKGAMHATSGKIGPFWISPDGFKDCLVSGTFESNPDSSKFTNYIKLSKDLLELVGKTSMVSDIAAGSMERVRITADMSEIDNYLNPIYVKVDGVPSYPAVAGIVVDAIGGWDGQNARAFWARKGSYGGFRRDVYSIEQKTGFNAGTLCCEGYGLVLMNNTAVVNITLPIKMEGLEIGSELIIIRGTSNFVLVGSKKRQCGKGLISSNLNVTATNEITHLYYFGENLGWFINFESVR